MGWVRNIEKRPTFDMVNIAIQTQDSLLADLEQHFENGRGFTVATLNLDHLVKLRRSEAFRDAYDRHTHVVADGNPIVWLNRLAGRQVGLVPGSDLVMPVAAVAARRSVSVALLGATTETIELAAHRLEAVNPNIDIVAKIAPSNNFDPFGTEADACLNEIEASGARLCMLALGAPKQELFAARGLERIPHCGFLSVGAGLDFIAGTKKRAPLWVRKLALEWLWRLASDRRRLTNRYRNCALLLPDLAVSALRYRMDRRSKAN